MPANPVALEIRHAVPGRARLRPKRHLGEKALKELGDRLASLPGVVRVLVRPNTTSIILEFAGKPEPLFETIHAQGIARIRPAPPPPPVGQVAQLGLLRADMLLKERTANTLDLNSAIALVLLVAAAVQAGRGQIVGPATTLLMSALSMIDRDRKT